VNLDTKEQDIEGVATEQRKDTSDQQQRKRWYTRFFSPLWVCLLIALALRVWLIVHTHGVIDGDEALVGIQAERILHGDFPVYFYGIPYFGSIEAYLVALVFVITGPSVWALRTEPLLISLLLVWLIWKFAHALADIAHLPPYARTSFTSIAILVAAVPPLYDGVIELRTFGGYIETFVLILLLLLATLQLTRRWHSGASSRELAWRWAAIGFIVGLGFWVYPLIATAVLAAALWIIGSVLIEMVKQYRQVPAGTKRSVTTIVSPAKGLLCAVAGIPTAILGFTPALTWGATHQWENITYIIRLGGTGSILNRLSTIRHVTKAYATCVAPTVISGTLPTVNNPLKAFHGPLLFVGAFCIFTTVAFIALSFFWQHQSLVRIRQLAALPTLFAACSAFAFCTSSSSVYVLLGCSLDDTGRYATPLMLALPFFFATIFTACDIYLYERGKRHLQNTMNGNSSTRRLSIKSTFRLSVVGQAILFGLLLVYLGTQAWTYGLTDAGKTFQSNYCTVDPANNDPIIAYMQQEHIHYFWASNLLGYPLVFKTNRSIVGADPRPLMHPRESINRIPSYTDAVLHADRPSMLVLIKHNDPHPLLLRLLDARKVTYHAAVFPSEPGYDVLVITPVSRTVSPLEKGFDIFTCYP